MKCRITSDEGTVEINLTADNMFEKQMLYNMRKEGFYVAELEYHQENRSYYDVSKQIDDMTGITITKKKETSELTPERKSE